MYSVRMRLVISLPSLFLATGSRICRPVDKSPSHPLSESVYPCRCSKPSPALRSPAPPTFSSRLRTLPRFGTSCSSVPLARVMSTGLLIQKSLLSSTRRRELRGASWMSVITSFSGSCGSTSPKATPLSVSYCPTVPKKAPPKATARELIWILVMRASAGSPMPARAIGSKLTNAARTNGFMVLSSSRTMLLVCAAPMQPRPRTGASFMGNAGEPAGEEEKMTTRREFVSQAAALTGIAFMGCDGLPAARAQVPRRREVVVSGRRVKTVDVHAHCGMPEAMALMGLKLAPASLVMADERIRRMDEQGIDVEALSINPYWYAAERDVVAKLIGIQNEKLAEICAAEPERFVAFASVPSFLGQGRGARRADLPPSAGHGRAEEPPARQRRAGKHRRQPARDDARALPPDLRGHARALSRPQDLRRPWRRPSAFLCAPLGSHLPHLPRALRGRSAEEAAYGISEAALLRFNRLHARSAAPPRRAGRQLAHRAGHGLPLSPG